MCIIEMNIHDFFYVLNSSSETLLPNLTFLRILSQKLLIFAANKKKQLCTEHIHAAKYASIIRVR